MVRGGIVFAVRRDGGRGAGQIRAPRSFSHIEDSMEVAGSDRYTVVTSPWLSSKESVQGGAKYGVATKPRFTMKTLAAGNKPSVAVRLYAKPKSRQNRVFIRLVYFRGPFPHRYLSQYIFFLFGACDFRPLRTIHRSVYDHDGLLTRGASTWAVKVITWAAIKDPTPVKLVDEG